MAKILTLEIPQNIYEALNKSAEQTGRTLEELALDWLAMASRAFIDDPVEDFIGVFRTNIPDWTDQHDKYIGQALAKELNNSYQEGN